ncbi:hypothetical protein BN1708_017919, partial [Verticillium longisporum]
QLDLHHRLGRRRSRRLLGPQPAAHPQVDVVHVHDIVPLHHRRHAHDARRCRRREAHRLRLDRGRPPPRLHRRIPRRHQHCRGLLEPLVLLQRHWRVQEPGRLAKGACPAPDLRHDPLPPRRHCHLRLRGPGRPVAGPQRCALAHDAQGHLGRRHPHHCHRWCHLRPRCRQVHLLPHVPRHQAHDPPHQALQPCLGRRHLGHLDPRHRHRRVHSRLQQPARPHRCPLRQLVLLRPPRHLLAVDAQGELLLQQGADVPLLRQRRALPDWLPHLRARP